jgi:hypothetical protein
MQWEQIIPENQYKVLDPAKIRRKPKSLASKKSLLFHSSHGRPQNLISDNPSFDSEPSNTTTQETDSTTSARPAPETISPAAEEAPGMTT